MFQLNKMATITTLVPEIKTITASVVEVKTFSEGNFLIKFKLPEKMNFKAGQFIMIHYKDKNRPFSIASPPSQETIELLIKKNKNGCVTPYLANMKSGDKLEISGPYGSFTVKPTDAEEIVFVAAGTGVAPFRAMIQDLLERGVNKKISLIFGFRYDFYFKEVWRELEMRYKNFKVYVVSSKPERNWTGLQGHVTEHFKEILKNAEGKEVYMCGPEEMMESSKNELLKIGFKPNQIHIEAWREVFSGK